MTAHAFEKLYEIVKKLRSPQGCPWDRAQNPATLRGALVEETYECIEAIDSGDAPHIQEELGDIFLLATMISFMFEETGAFSVSSVLDGITDKLVRRHPHVFGDAPLKNADEVLVEWARIKVEKEGRPVKDSIVDEVPRTLPPLDRAYKLQKKAAKAGFDWPAWEGALDKFDEEYHEVRHELERSPDAASAALESELGDLLFAAVNLCRKLDVEPSIALQRTNIKFVNRFRHVEARMKAANLPMTQQNIDRMNAFWDEAKNAETP